jgi:hypothetical protein
MSEVVVALIGVVGLAIPAYLNYFTGESRALKNLRARIELYKAMPDELDTEKEDLKRSIYVETMKSTVPQYPPVWSIGLAILMCLGAALTSDRPWAYFPDENPDTVRAWATFTSLVAAAYLAVAAYMFNEVRRVLKTRAGRLKQEIEKKQAELAELEARMEEQDARES